MRTTVALPLLLAATLGGCASRRPTTVTTSETVRVGGVGAQPGTTLATVSAVNPGTVRLLAPVERVWAVMPAVYDSLGIPVARVEQARHIISNEGFKLRRRLGNVPLTRYLDCGRAQGGPSAETYKVNLAVLTELLPDGEGRTTAATVVKASARPVTFAGEFSTCTSTTALEMRIGELIRELLAGR